jgi:hypothetical protein
MPQILSSDSGGGQREKATVNLPYGRGQIQHLKEHTSGFDISLMALHSITIFCLAQELSCSLRQFSPNVAEGLSSNDSMGVNGGSQICVAMKHVSKVAF